MIYLVQLSLIAIDYFEETSAGINEKEAFNYYQRAADLGYAKGLTNLGVCYLKGIHVTKDSISAKKVATNAIFC